jgi:hypothetical protein
MQRRRFLKSALTATAAASLSQNLAMAAESTDQPAREFYELRLYHLRRGPKQQLFDEFYRQAAIPAMNRIGLGPIGVFNVATGPDSPTMYVLIPHKSLDSFATATDRVRSDSEYQKAGAAFINVAATDPAYVRPTACARTPNTKKQELRLSMPPRPTRLTSASKVRSWSHLKECPNWRCPP